MAGMSIAESAITRGWILVTLGREAAEHGSIGFNGLGLRNSHSRLSLLMRGLSYALGNRFAAGEDFLHGAIPLINRDVGISVTVRIRIRDGDETKRLPT
jgi:hypothetical protein